MRNEPADSPLSRHDILSAGEVAALLGLPRSTVYDYARRGLLPARQIARLAARETPPWRFCRF